MLEGGILGENPSLNYISLNTIRVVIKLSHTNFKFLYITEMRSQEWRLGRGNAYLSDFFSPGFT